MILGHEERIFREVMYPNLLLRFQNVSDESAQKIVDGSGGGSAIRDKAFRIMLDRITPAHLRDQESDATRSQARRVLPMLTQRAAEGIVQASEAHLLEGAIFTRSRLPVLWPHILSIAEADRRVD